jgi:hypothetical protein
MKEQSSGELHYQQRGCNLNTLQYLLVTPLSTVLPSGVASRNHLKQRKAKLIRVLWVKDLKNYESSFKV